MASCLHVLIFVMKSRVWLGMAYSYSCKYEHLAVQIFKNLLSGCLSFHYPQTPLESNQRGPTAQCVPNRDAVIDTAPFLGKYCRDKRYEPSVTTERQLSRFGCGVHSLQISQVWEYVLSRKKRTLCTSIQTSCPDFNPDSYEAVGCSTNYITSRDSPENQWNLHTCEKGPNPKRWPCEMSARSRSTREGPCSESSLPAGRKIWYKPLWKTVWRFLWNEMHFLPYHLAITLLGIFLTQR